MDEDGEKSLDPQFWHACAGGMVQIPPANSKVFYFPQGHAEHTLSDVDFRALPRIPGMILCEVVGIKFLADLETDEVYANIRLIPVGNDKHCDLNYDEDIGSELAEKPMFLAKMLTLSDANNGGTFSVPMHCAEAIFPRLDRNADPPVQTIIAKDVHGETWKFKHIYRGVPKRHLLTTGWNNFVNQKKLVAGDSVVFLRAKNGDLCVGIRRAKRGGLEGTEFPSGWNIGAGSDGGFSRTVREDENKQVSNINNGNPYASGRGRGRPEAVIEAVSLAANGQPFEVVYHPCAGTPEFCVKASSVSAAMRIQWCSGLRFKMAFETKDSCRISWFMGTVASVQVADPILWPNSPWRLLQVTWDEPELLQNVKCVSPWLVELVSNMPILHLSLFSPPQKKLRLSQQVDISLDGQFPLPSFLGNPLGPSSPFCCLPNNTTAGIQGARHAQYGVPLVDLHPSKKLQLSSPSIQRLDSYAKISDGIIRDHPDGNENTSCLLTIGTSSDKSEKSKNVKTPQFLLFGQPILTEEQMSHGCFGNAISQHPKGKSSSSGIPLKAKNFDLDRQGFRESLSFSAYLLNQSCDEAELGLDTDHCKIFLESEDVGRALDLLTLSSYKDLYERLANMFGTEKSNLLSNVVYQDVTGALKHVGDEPFSDFVKTTKRLTIVMNSQ